MNKMSQVMRQFLLVSAVALAVPAVAVAGDDHREHHAHMDQKEHKGKRAERMFEALNLDESQKQKAQALMQAHREKMKSEREAFIAQLDEILTPEQREKAKAMREKHEERRRNRDEMEKDS